MIADGKIHRVKGASGKSGWYVSHGTWGAWGDWATGEKHTFNNVEYNKGCIKDAIKKRKKDDLMRHKEVAEKCKDIWENKADHIMRHDYLVRKQIHEHAVKWWGSDLLIPVCGVDGKIWNLQRILENGKKFFIKGGRKKGCMFRFGEIKPNSIICEGYATGASIHQITGLPVVVAFDAYNLYDVCKILVKKYPETAFYIAMDDDACKPHSGNTGEREAMKCYSDFHFGLIKPVFQQKNLTDFNDLHVMEGKEAVYRHFEFLINGNK